MTHAVPLALLDEFPEEGPLSSRQNDEQSLLQDGELVDGSEDTDDEINEAWEEEEKPQRVETFQEFMTRQWRNVVHFLVEDWMLSGMLGVFTAILSIFMDVAIEYQQHYRIILYEWALEYSVYHGFVMWILFITLSVTAASLICHSISKQAVGSGIPEVKVIIHGFALKNYLTLKTLFAKVVGLTLTLGAGMPVGKEGPFVHIGAIIASQLNKATESCQFNAFFSNEGRGVEMLSTGCAVGIACTFSAPAGAVLYGIESTSKYFAVKNYWRQFFATTCSALIFRFAMAAIVPQHIAGTIMAYYQTNFPNEVFLVEEIPFFVLLGLICGVAGAFFIFVHRWIAMFRRKNKVYLSLFGKSPVAFTALMAMFYAFLSFPDGLGQFFAGRYTFRETLADFISNCTFTLSNKSEIGCAPELIAHWTGSPDAALVHPLAHLSTYLVVYFFMVAIFVSLYIPAGIFVPSFVIGACGGRICGEILTLFWPDGLRGPDGPHIYPGLYAVVGAAAYTGAVTHSLSLAVIVCETTGQLCALLPVLIALMIANAVCTFLQPSIYESIIKIQGYPYLADLPPSRISTHTLKVEKVMVKDLIYLTRETTYRELREVLIETPSLRSYPFVTDRDSMILLGSVSRKYLIYLLNKNVGPEPMLHHGRRSRRASEILNALGSLRRSSPQSIPTNSTSLSLENEYLTDRQISGSTLMAHSPLHDEQRGRGPLAPFLLRQADTESEGAPSYTMSERAAMLATRLNMDEIAIDPAPFQLVKGTSLYKVHTLFSLLALNHAYVTERGRLVGVVSVKELREALNNIYTRGAVAVRPRSGTFSSQRHLNQPAQPAQPDQPNQNNPQQFI